MQAYFDVCLPAENEGISLSETHALVHQLPETAFSEAVEALSGMYSFYRKQPESIAIPAPAPVKARVTANYTVPVYPISED